LMTHVAGFVRATQTFFENRPALGAVLHGRALCPKSDTQRDVRAR
jgi:hypothetical protein